MRILLLNQFFWPDSSATSQLLTDLARGLVERGHIVDSISAGGGYAPAANDPAPPVNMIYVRALPFARGKLGRLLSYVSYYPLAFARALTLPRADLVVTLTTPPLLSLLGSLLKATRGSRHVIWEMDVYPDVAVDLKYFRRDGVIHSVTGWLADAARHYADGIIALGECMKERLVARGVTPAKIAVADNWADGSAIVPIARPADGSLTLLYSGNLGLAHDLDTITDAIVKLSGDNRFHFVFVGGGSRRAALEQFCRERQLSSVELRPYAQRESLGESLSQGDVGLVTQRDACVGSVVPSKIYGLLAAGRPILYIGPRDATPARIVDHFQCGWQVSCGNSEALTALLQHLVEHPETVAQAGQNARRALLTHFDLPLGVDRIAKILGANWLSGVPHPSASPAHEQVPPPRHAELFSR